MNKRQFLSLVGMLFCLIGWSITTPEDGKYYRIVNQNPDKSVNTEGVRHGYVITENTTSHGLTAQEPGSNTKYTQLWKYTGKKFQNAHTSRYISGLSRSVQAVTQTTGQAVTLTDKGTYFLLTCSMQIHADGSNNIVGWNDDGNKSNWWDFEEVEVDENALALVQEQYKKEQAEKASLEAIAAKASTYAPIVAGYFKDGACTELNDACAAKTDDQMKEMMTADGLPEQIQNIVLRIKNKWNDELNPTLSERFRVQSYKCYSQAGIKHTPKSTQLSDQNNPTGIWTNSLQLMFVFVENDIPDGTSLRIASSDGAEVSRVWWNNGTELHKGLNIIYCGTDNAYQWIMYTAPGAIGQRIDRFPELKIHIEGGDVLGYANVAGLDEEAANAEYELTLKNAKAIMAQKGVSTKKMNFAVKGVRGLFLFPVDAYNQIWGDQAWNGNKYGYKIYKSMKFYDDVLMWEWSAMGWQDRVENGEAENTMEHLSAGSGDAWYPSYINNLAPAMMYYAGKNPYSSDGYTCMPSVGAIESSYNAERADFDTWCVGHESGHNNQGTINLPSSMESSNNYFSNIITYLHGYRMSRGMTFMENMDYSQNDVIFPLRSISITLRMYFNLYLYYHRAGNNMGFSQKLHKLLRDDPMNFGGNGWYEGPSGGANRGDAKNSWLKFYEKACEAAGEDLTEYFRLWGFFIPVTDAYCGDYSSYYITCKQSDIDTAIKRVKAKGYRENKEIMFIEDRLVPQQRTDIWATPGAIKPTNDGNLNFDEAKLKQWFGDLGYVDEYVKGQATVAENYTYTVAGRNVTMTGKGGVGIIVYKEDGTIGYMSNRLSFTMPAEVAAGNFSIKVIQGDGVEVEAKNAIDSDDPDAQKGALQAAVDASEDLTKLVDDKTVGFYQTSSVSKLQELVKQGREALANGDTSKYKELAKAIGDEIINVNLNATKNELKLSAVYSLRNYQFSNQQNYPNDKSYLCSGTSATETAKEATAQWLFVSAGSNTYYLQNKGTEKYISNLGDNGAFGVKAETVKDAIVWRLVEAGEGTYYIQNTATGKNINETPSWRGIISWGEGEGSQWYISEVGEIEEFYTGEQINELIGLAQSLQDKAGTINTTRTKLTLQDTDATAPYYIKTNKPDANYPVSILLDGSKSTSFYTDKTKTASPYHYLLVDLGEGNEVDAVRFNYCTTKEMDGRSPATIIVTPGNKSTAFSNEKTTFDDLPTGLTKQEIKAIDATASKPYRFWRLQVAAVNAENAGAYPYFGMAYLNMYATQDNVALNAGYEDLNPQLVKDMKAAIETAKEAVASSNTYLSNTETYKALKAVYDKLAEAMENATGIVNVTSVNNADKTLFDLSGRRVGKVTKSGIYVIGGKKVMIK